MKNTALVLISAALATLLVLMGIGLVNYDAPWDFYVTFWSNYWQLGILGWIIIIVACGAGASAFFLASREEGIISYALGAAAGVCLGIIIQMVNFAILD